MYNDIHHWPTILASVPTYGPIFHSDYSENMSQMHKHEIQPAHFNKRSHSLHCSVEHINHDDYPNMKSPYVYHFHLSDEIKHDFAFTSIVAEQCLQGRELPKIIRRKIDNCATQYKCALVFGEYQKLSQKFNRKVIVYYGAAGHGKGLVDAMGAFGVKSPLRKAVWMHGFKYNCAQDICQLLKNEFSDDPSKQKR